MLSYIVCNPSVFVQIDKSFVAGVLWNYDKGKCMATPYDLNVQCFVKHEAQPLFADQHAPQLLYVSHVRPSTNPHPRILHSHEHHLELLLICEGSSEFMIHNQRRKVQQGDLVVYNAGIVHDDLTGPETDVGLYCIAASGIAVPGLKENALIPDDAPCVYPAKERYALIRHLCEIMFETLSEDARDAEILCQSLLQSVLTAALLTVRHMDAAPSEEIAEDRILSERVRTYIDAHYTEPINLQTIAEHLHVSPYYMSHVFKKMSGYSPIQYLLRRRIGEAQTLLISTDLPIVEIAMAVGFDTQNYFNAQFTKHVGVPPKKYRENYVI